MADGDRGDPRVLPGLGVASGSRDCDEPDDRVRRDGDVRGGGRLRRGRRFFDRVKVVQRAASLGGVESLCSLPVLTSQYGFSDQQLHAAGVTAGMVRVSIGLEHPDDLIADFDQALA